jgi:hypothetical protein
VSSALRDHFGPDPDLFDEEQTDFIYEEPQRYCEKGKPMTPKFYEIEDFNRNEVYIVPSRDLDYEIAYWGHDNLAFRPVPSAEVEEILPPPHRQPRYRRRGLEEMMKRDLIEALKEWRSVSVSEYSVDPLHHDPKFKAIVERHHLQGLVGTSEEQF